MKTKIFGLILLAVSAGLFALARTNGFAPSDLRDAVADFDTSLPLIDKSNGNIPVPEAVVPVQAEEKHAVSAKPLKWVTIQGGKYMMGAKHTAAVEVKTFEISKTLVTVGQYEECVIKGRCTKPGTESYSECNWGKPGRQDHPVNCVDFAQANQYARFKGARLPSEAEWEYAATSRGKNQLYPGRKEREGCYSDCLATDGRRTRPVCSKPFGNTEQGLCDMVSNVWQWVQYDSQSASSMRALRGGSYDYFARQVRDPSYRFDMPNECLGPHGFRIVK